MTRRQDLDRYRHSLEEIRNIMNSMKSLAYMETRKLARFLDAQRAVVGQLERVAADFLSFFPEAAPETDDVLCVYLVIGTERGFCGDLNRVLARHLEASLTARPSDRTVLIPVGRKLQLLLEEDARVRFRIEGASIVEDVAVVLREIVEKLSALQRENSMLKVWGCYHDGDEGVVERLLLPPFDRSGWHPAPCFNHPPVLNLAPETFVLELAEQFFRAVMYELLYVSLMTENQDRMMHLDGAVRHLDEEAEELTRQYNAVRQEEIIEEIEVILLSSEPIEESASRKQRPRSAPQNEN